MLITDDVPYAFMDEGVALLLRAAAAQPMTLHLFVNGDARMKRDLRRSDLREPRKGGWYRPIPLHGTRWTVARTAAGTFARYNEYLGFAPDGEGKAETAYGWFVVAARTGQVWLAERFGEPLVLNGEFSMSVRPAFGFPEVPA